MGGIKGRKQRKKLARRVKDWLPVPPTLPGFKKPGSNKK